MPIGEISIYLRIGGSWTLAGNIMAGSKMIFGGGERGTHTWYRVDSGREKRSRQVGSNPNRKYFPCFDVVGSHENLIFDLWREKSEKFLFFVAELSVCDECKRPKRPDDPRFRHQQPFSPGCP